MIEDLLAKMPETIEVSPEQYVQYVMKDVYQYTDEELERINVDWWSTAYIAITTNSARYKVKDEEGYWIDLVCFEGAPVEATTRLYEWLKTNKYIDD